MRTIAMSVPDDCRECRYYAKAEEGKKTYRNIYHLCPEYARILLLDIDADGKLQKVNPCQECLEGEKNGEWYR